MTEANNKVDAQLKALKNSLESKGMKLKRRLRGTKLYIVVEFPEQVETIPYGVLRNFILSYVPSAYMTSYGAYTSATFRIGDYYK